MLYFDRIDVSEGIDVNKRNQSKDYDICTIGAFWIKAINFNQMPAIDAMIF